VDAANNIPTSKHQVSSEQQQADIEITANLLEFIRTLIEFDESDRNQETRL
jgi:hypothetical protein